MSNYRPNEPFVVPLWLLIPQTKLIKGITKKVYPETGILFYASFKTFGGTERTNNDGWQELMQSIDRAAGEEGLKKATEAALKASKEYVNEQVTAIMRKANMPAKGKFWTGDTKATLDKNFTVAWEGFTGEIKIGFDLSESLVSNFLMYGTPRHEPPMAAVPGLYDAVYGRKTQIAITYLQREAIEKWIERNMG